MFKGNGASKDILVYSSRGRYCRKCDAHPVHEIRASKDKLVYMSRGRCCRKHMHTWCIMTKPVGISWCICRDEGAIQSTMHAQCTKSEPVGKAGLYVRNCVEFWNVNCLVGPMKGSVLLYV